MQHKLYAIAMLFLVIGGLNWGYVAFTGKDLISYALGKGALTNAIFLFVGVAALSIAFFRDTYLPFLGGAVMPCSILKEQTPEGADTEVRVFVEPGTKVMYWAAEPANKDLKKVQDWRQAYISYRNAGVAVADADGYATLKVRRPQSYLVPFKGELQPHIHYRVCHGEGMMARVMTVTLDGKEYFENPEEEDFANPDEDDEGFANPDEEEDFANPDEEDEGFANPDEEEDFANPDEDDEGFANPDEDDEGFANQEEDDDNFANPDEDDDNFANYGRQETDGAVSGIPAPGFPANNAVPELNEVAQRTAQRSLMPETGGLLEAPHPSGYDLNAAFAAPAPPKYTAVKYA